MVRRGIYLLTSICVFAIMIWVIVDARKPWIETLGVEYTYQGMVALRGRHFGSEPSDIFLNAQPLDRKSIVEWNDDEIRFLIPESFSSGLISIKQKTRRSNEVLFLRNEAITVREEEESVVSLGEEEVSIGDLVNISLSSTVISKPLRVYMHFGDGRIEVLDDIYIDYKTDDEISIQVPATQPQKISIHTPAKEFEINVSYTDEIPVIYDLPRAYFLVQTIMVTEKDMGGSRVGILVPRLLNHPELQFVDPSMSEVLPPIYYISEPVHEHMSVHVVRQRAVWQIEALEVENQYASKFYQTYTREEFLGEELESLVDTLVRGLDGSDLEDVITIAERMDVAFIEEHIISSNDASLITLQSLRRLGIPARRVSGYIFDTRLIPYQWTEYFVFGVGWVPFDIYFTRMLVQDSDLAGVETFFFSSNRHIRLELHDFFVSEAGEDVRHTVQLLPPTEYAYSANGRYFFVTDGLPQGNIDQ